MKKLKNVVLLMMSLLLLQSCSNYSTGERVGIITKFSEKGALTNCKSFEGDLKIAPNIVNGGMVGQYEDFYFSIDNDQTVKCETLIDSINQYARESIPVILQYQEVKFLNWFSNRGDTNYFIKSINRTKYTSKPISNIPIRDTKSQYI